MTLRSLALRTKKSLSGLYTFAHVEQRSKETPYVFHKVCLQTSANQILGPRHLREEQLRRSAHLHQMLPRQGRQFSESML